MSALIISACPGAGGNHISNLLRLSNQVQPRLDFEYLNQKYQEVSSATFHFWEDAGIPISQIVKNINSSQKTYVICAHIDNRELISSILEQCDSKAVVVTAPTTENFLERVIREHRGFPHSHIFTEYTAKNFEDKYNLTGEKILEINHDQYYGRDIVPMISLINNFANLEQNEQNYRDLHDIWWGKVFDK